MIPTKDIPEDMMSGIDKVRYLYEKTGFYEYAEEYFRLSKELMRIGVKVEQLPLLKKGGT